MPKTPLSFYLHIIAIAVIVFALGHFLSAESADTKTASKESAYDRVVNSKTIRCGYIVWPPAFIKDANSGELSGINYDFMQALGKEMGMKVEWVEEVGIGNVPEALRSGRIDLMCASMWPDAAKAPLVGFTVPTYFSAVFAYARFDDHRFDGNLAAINSKNYKACGIEGDITLKALLNNFSDLEILSLPPSSDGAQLILNLVSKKCDMILIDDPLAEDFLRQNPNSIRKIANVPPVRIYGEHLVLANTEIKFKNLLDTMIQTLINSGEMDRILAKYPSVFAAPQKNFDKITK